MKKINKTCDLSTEYKNWEEALEKAKTPHPPYKSSNSKYYWDVVMQLFKCQKGLCAYTEQELCDEIHFADNRWENGKYQGTPPPEGRFGQLEHFDEKLKSKKGAKSGIKDWLWDNFFMVHSDINNRKGNKEIDDILKPDRDGYDPFELLEYHPETHVFSPKSNLAQDIFDRVKYMIDVLGVNHVYAIRRKYLRNRFRLARLEAPNPPVEEVVPKQFPTAFKMCILLLQNRDTSLRELSK